MPAYEATSWPLSADQLLDKLSGNRWVPLTANLAALVLLVYGLAQWTWRLLEPSTPPPTATSRTADPNQPALDLQSLLAAHLFGRATDTAARSVNPEQLPLSSLNLVLTGVIAHGALSFALLSINGAPETPVMVGQEVSAGAILEAVYADRIVLRRGATLEGVLLKDDTAALPAGSIVSSRPDSAANNAVRSLGGGSYSIDRQALTQNLNAETLSQAAVVSGAGGLAVREVQAGGVFDKLGLKTGDVVRNINGQPVTSLDDVVKAYAQFATNPQAGRVAVEVLRGGKTEVLQYQMQ